MNPEQKWYTVAQVAEKMQMHKATVYRAIHRGNLPAVKLGEGLYRISEKDLETWFAKMKVKPKEKD